MPGPLKNDDEAIPRPRVAEPDEELTPGDDATAGSRTETNIELGELPGDGEVLPTPMEQEQDRAANEDGALGSTESPEDKADDIINGGIVHM